MSVPYSKICEAEEQLLEHFPRYPMPNVEAKGRTVFGFECKRILSGKTWSEVIGLRLTYGEMDISLSSWVDILSLDTFVYYLPAHLHLAAFGLSNGVELNYAYQVMEAFILPTSEDENKLKEIDDELLSDTSVIEFGSLRLDVYRRLTPGQRQCVANYLSIYFECEGGFTERGVELFQENMDIWSKSRL